MKYTPTSNKENYNVRIFNIFEHLLASNDNWHVFHMPWIPYYKVMPSSIGRDQELVKWVYCLLQVFGKSTFILLMNQRLSRARSAGNLACRNVGTTANVVL